MEVQTPSLIEESKEAAASTDPPAEEDEEYNLLADLIGFWWILNFYSF